MPGYHDNISQFFRALPVAGVLAASTAFVSPAFAGPQPETHSAAAARFAQAGGGAAGWGAELVRVSDEAPAEDVVAGRTLVFEEQFTELRPDIWEFGGYPNNFDAGHYGGAAFAPWGGTDGHDPYSIAEDADAENGTALQIVAQYLGEAPTIPHYYDYENPRFWWISGQIAGARRDTTFLHGFRNGYFEVRMKMPEHPITWPAFWLLNKGSLGHETRMYSTEIDVVEHHGFSRDRYGAYLHEWAPEEEEQHHEGTYPMIVDVEDLRNEYHLYGVEIDGDKVRPYFNRVRLTDIETGAPVEWTMTRVEELDANDDAFFPIISLAIAADYAVNQPTPPDIPGDATLYVDYYKVWQ